MNYANYLRTPHWKKVRAAALKFAHYRCQLCYSDGPLEVHHRTYIRRGKERPSDVVALCSDCHETFHKNRTLAKAEGPSDALVALIRKQNAA